LSPTIYGKRYKAIGISCVLLVALMGNAHGSDVTSAAGYRIGQWIWSRVDERIFKESRESLPDLVPSLWVSTIEASDGALVQKLALTPALGKSIRSMGIVVRIDDNVHALWKTLPAEKIGTDIDGRLHRLMELLAAAHVHVDEVQLDYDCPVSRLTEWAEVLRLITARSLRGKAVWITSLPSHLDDPAYGARFRGATAGHILQLFDTGVSCNQDTLNRLSDRLRKQAMPFRIGLGAFERRRSGRLTDHELWFSAVPSFAALPGYQGVWIFPGGKKWLHLHAFPKPH
jgi:hypothetical protein